jgi:hypothetical protein
MSFYFIFCLLLSSPYLHFIFLPLYQSAPVTEHTLSFSYNAPTHSLMLPLHNTAPTGLFSISGLLPPCIRVSCLSHRFFSFSTDRYSESQKIWCISIKLHDITSKKDNNLLQKILKTSFSNKDRICSSYTVTHFI